MTQRTDLQPTEGRHADTFSGEAGLTHSGTRSKRAVRIAVVLPIELRDQFGGRHDARTQFVMLRGAVLSTNSSLRVGHKLTVQNLKSGRSAECHVISIEPAAGGAHQIEIEFTGPQTDFWPVQFPSEDARVGETPNISGKAVRAGSENVHDDIVVLADSVATSLSSRSAERVVARMGSVDSVAQFRAANRAAHRHEQRMKAFYSLLSIAALAGATMGGRYWLNHHQDNASMNPTPTIKSVAEKIAQVLPAKKTSPIPAAVSSEAPAQDQTITNPATSGSAASQISSPDPAALESANSVPPPTSDANEQIAVRHGSSMASKRHNSEDSSDEPVALVLRADAALQPKPEALKDVVAGVPVRTAVLAPQVPKRVVPAKLLHSMPAQYPAMARQLHVEGAVVLDLSVDASGAVKDVKVVSGPPLLRPAAMDAVRRWRYQPATLGDKPVSSTETVKVDFHWR
jgi:TonB family protein